MFQVILLYYLIPLVVRFDRYDIREVIEIRIEVTLEAITAVEYQLLW